MPIITGGGGVGSQTVLVASQNVSSAQILALNTTPVVITPTPAASKIIWPQSILFRQRFVSAAYNTNGDGLLYVSTIQEYTVENNGGFWATWPFLSFLFDDLKLASFSDDVSVAGVSGKPLALFTGSPLMAFTDGTNTLTTYVSYILLDA